VSPRRAGPVGGGGGTSSDSRFNPNKDCKSGHGTPGSTPTTKPSHGRQELHVPEVQPERRQEMKPIRQTPAGDGIPRPSGRFPADQRRTHGTKGRTCAACPAGRAPRMARFVLRAQRPMQRRRQCHGPRPTRARSATKGRLPRVRACGTRQVRPRPAVPQGRKGPGRRCPASRDRRTGRTSGGVVTRSASSPRPDHREARGLHKQDERKPRPDRGQVRAVPKSRRRQHLQHTTRCPPVQARRQH